MPCNVIISNGILSEFGASCPTGACREKGIRHLLKLWGVLTWHEKKKRCVSCLYDGPVLDGAGLEVEEDAGLYHFVSFCLVG